MKRFFPLICLSVAVFIFLLFPVSVVLPQTRSAPESKLKPELLLPGQKGYGLSCFQGKTLERMEVEILGIVNNGAPEFSTILAKVRGNSVDVGGIMSGMSGSPVYIDDTLIGAMAFAFPFAKESICGITPIEAMNDLWKGTVPRSQPMGKTFVNLSRFFKSPVESKASMMMPIGIPLICSGLSPAAIDRFASLESLNLFTPVSGGIASGQTQTSRAIQAGEPIGVLFIDGDIRIAGMGTATSVERDRVLALGHSMFGLGECDLPMISGEAVTFIPSLSQSFKIMNMGPPVGRIIRDSQSGVAGILGQNPPLIPVEIILEGVGGSAQKYSIQVIGEESYTSFFTGIGIAGILSRTGPEKGGDLSYQFDIAIDFNEGKQLKYRKVSGSALGPYEEIFNALAPFQRLLQNPIEKVHIEKIQFHGFVNEEIQFVVLESIRQLNDEVKPGGNVEFELGFRGYRIPAQIRRVSLTVPVNIQPGTYTIGILDSESYRLWEGTRYLPEYRYNDIDSFLKELNENFAEDALHMMLVKHGRDIVVKGNILPDSPPTLESVMRLPDSGSEIRTNPIPIVEETIQFPFHVVGSHRAEITVKREE